MALIFCAALRSLSSVTDSTSSNIDTLQDLEASSSDTKTFLVLSSKKPSRTIKNGSFQVAQGIIKGGDNFNYVSHLPVVVKLGTFVDYAGLYCPLC